MVTLGYGCRIDVLFIGRPTCRVTQMPFLAVGTGAPTLHGRGFSNTRQSVRRGDRTVAVAMMNYCKN